MACLSGFAGAAAGGGGVEPGWCARAVTCSVGGEYGVSVEIPEVLRPKMKGSAVLAKNLRALSALGPCSTELAHQAQEQALAISDEE